VDDYEHPELGAQAKQVEALVDLRMNRIGD
jgi:hypothetical protein